MKKISLGSLLVAVVTISLYAQYEPEIIFEVLGDTLNQQLGHHTLVPVGDVDGDGYDDILANAFTSGQAWPHSREWRIYYGSEDGTERYTAFARMDSIADNYLLNYEGFFDDMDGDGHLDIFAVYIRGNYPNDSYMRILFHGGPDFNTIPDWISPWQVYGGGDIVGDYDGDGYADYVTIDINEGRFWFHRGGMEPDSLPSWSFSRNDDSYGTRNAGFGDINGDEYDDFIRYGWRAEYPDSNAMDIFLGGRQADSLPDITYRYPFWLSYTWRIIPDLNGDGFDDVLGRTVHELDCTYVHFGKNPFELSWDLQVWPAAYPAAYEWYSSVGDINGDGYNDMAFSGHLAGSGQLGDLAIYLGGRWMDGHADIHIWGEHGGENGYYYQLGYRTVSAGDFNGDGIQDWAYSSRGPGNADGRITVVSGDTSLHVSVPQDKGSLLPKSLKLLPPYPNPFNPEITIPIEVSRNQSDVRLQIVNTLGQRVYAFPSEHLDVGLHKLTWNGRAQSGRLAASGRYFVRLLSSEGVQVQPIVLQR
ncbi:T9SS type A sorting domain-containing protein [bacterium]|nr:T9SS type A sorting domain-containing protein [bacterium]